MPTQAAAQGSRPYSIPATAPAYPPPPYEYHGNRIVRIHFMSDPEVMAALVPPPLRVIPGRPVSIYIGLLTIVAPFHLAYHEVGVIIPVAHGDAVGVYVPYMYLDSTLAILAGREILGFPKQEAEIELNEGEDAVSVLVRRQRTRLIRATLQLESEVKPIPQRPSLPWYNLKLIPSARRGAPPDVWQLTSTVISPRATQLFRGPATLELGRSDTAPLGDIPVREIVAAEWLVYDMTLDYGEVAFDYLAQR